MSCGMSSVLQNNRKLKKNLNPHDMKLNFSVHCSDIARFLKLCNVFFFFFFFVFIWFIWVFSRCSDRQPLNKTVLKYLVFSLFLVYTCTNTYKRRIFYSFHTYSIQPFSVTFTLFPSSRKSYKEANLPLNLVTINTACVS